MTRQDTSTFNELDALMIEFFRAVSFQEGERPFYANLYPLFISGGNLIKASGATPEIATVQQFIAPRQHLVDSGQLTSFQETELSYTLELFGNVAHRFSIYEKHGTQQGIAIDARGKISTQFVHTPDGWKIASMAWDDERLGLTMTN